MVIYLRPLLPAASSNLPGGVTERAAPCLKGFLLLGLAPGGVCRATPVASRAVSSYLTLSPLPVPLRAIGGLLSVALVVGLRLPGVTWHPALWSPDFPPSCLSTRMHNNKTATAQPTPRAL